MTEVTNGQTEHNHKVEDDLTRRRGPLATDVVNKVGARGFMEDTVSDVQRHHNKPEVKEENGEAPVLANQEGGVNGKRIYSSSSNTDLDVPSFVKKTQDSPEYKAAQEAHVASTQGTAAAEEPESRMLFTDKATGRVGTNKEHLTAGGHYVHPTIPNLTTLNQNNIRK